MKPADWKEIGLFYVNYQSVMKKHQHRGLPDISQEESMLFRGSGRRDFPQGREVSIEV